jgi:phospholipid transport system substrate-binding protein
MHRLWVATFALCVGLAASSALAQEVAPDVLMKAAIVDVIAIIKQDEGIQAGKLGNGADLVESRIFSLFDFTHMTQIAVARHWRMATPVQRKALTAEFKLMLVRNYTATLSGYRDRVFEFKPLRTAAADTEVTVKSVINQSGTESLTMNYDMEKLATGWKVYDIKIDGRSLVSAYRESFAGKVRDGGLEGLKASLADTNRRGDTRISLHESEVLYFPIFVWGILQHAR